MTEEMGVHNFVVNGRIGEDCGIGAVTIKELKGLPDCGCGDCNGIVGLGSGDGGVPVVRPVENGESGEKDGVCSVVVKERGDDGFHVESKEAFDNGGEEGDDQIEPVVEKRENRVLENGDCGINGHVTEVDLAGGKPGDEGVERIPGEVVETDHCVDENRENGAVENGGYRADGLVEVNNIKVVGDTIWNVNGKIGEDCAMGGAVTMKELKGLPDCGCGECSGIVGFSGKGSIGVARDVNQSKQNVACIVAEKESGNDGFGADQKGVFENRRVEVDDRTGNCAAEDEVNARENGVLQNGYCDTNGHVNEINVDLAEGKHRDEAVERISEEVETDHVVDKNRDNGVMEDVDYKAGELAEKEKVKVIEEGIWYVNGKIGVDCAIGAVTMKELKGLPDCGCGNCSVIVGFGCKGSDAFVQDVKKNKKDMIRGVPVTESGDNTFGADQKDAFGNGKAEGNDRIGNCAAKEDEVNERENGVMQNGDCDTNGHVNEINVDLAKRKHRDEAVERTSEKVETDHVVDKNRDNGVMEDMAYKADGLVEENKVKVVEKGIWYVNGRIGEDCAIGAVTMKELKDLPDCGCGCCGGIVGFSTKGSDTVVRDAKKNKKDMIRGVPVMESGDSAFGADRKDAFENGKAEGDDRIGNCAAKEDEVNARETGALQNGDSDTNGHINVINVDLAEGKHSDEGVERISEEVQTDCVADKNRDNGVMDDMAYKADGLVEENKVKVIEEGIWYGNGRIREDCAIGAVTMKELKGLPDCGCGDCCGIVGFSSNRSAAVVRDAKNGNSGRKESVKDVVCSVSVKESANNRFTANQKVFENGKVEVIEDSIHDVNTVKNVVESDIADHNEPSNCNGYEDCTLSNSVAIEESLSGFLDAKLEDALVEDQNRKADNVQQDLVNASSVAAKEELLHVEVEKEYFVKGEVTDSDPVKTETRQEKDSASVDTADAEAVICFGSLGQREFSNLSCEDVTEKEEVQNTVPEPEAEVVEATSQSDVVVAEARPAASPKGQDQASEVYKKFFNYMIKIPRFEDDRLKSKINYAQLQVDEKTKRRDSVKAEMQGKREIHRESNEKFGAAVTEEKSARELLKSKRQDIDSVQSEINKVKNAMSVSEIDTEISGMEHRIQHETLPLKEERELINKIRKLKQLRGQMPSSIGGQDELTEALNNREQTEERLKNLRKDADTLRENCLKAEAVTRATKKIYQDDSEKLHELQARFKEANRTRQEAYVQLQSLKKELYEKSKPFWKYRDDAKMAADLALKDRDSLSQFCIEQVENFMEEWNKSDEFREEYLKSNARRTLRRLGTADGRSLGPNEEPPSLPPVVNERSAPEKSFPSLPSPKQENVARDVRVGSAADNVLKKDSDTEKQKPKARNAIKAPTQLEMLMAITERDKIVEEKEPELTEEEQELASKAEELRKKEEAEKLLEQRRLEEKAKAKEALERKKRNAERAEARAAQKAQKEAELKEKEREKRAKKKEKKKSVSNMASDDIPEVESHTPSETIVEATPVEPEMKPKPAPMRRPSKPSHFAKQTKIAPIPAPLRNRGKRKMQPWMWAVLVAVLVFVLLLMGNVWNLF
ncbi:hypothetical protein MLD38_012798 [Melastoma candidum]|uniref:Uncharacterized protein n=1 Tax=Melastoma candidum TaxID=119954 RepID=A0ACB9RBP4_9MYRT|nr:hypothetical protein MLD38_012798 [Melastoma candidum]